MRKLLYVFIALFIFSCTDNTKIEEVYRSENQVNWRLDRMKELLGDFNTDPLEDYKEQFKWELEDIVKTYDRLVSEINDMEDKKTATGYSYKEYDEAKSVLTDLENNCKKLNTMANAAKEKIEYTDDESSKNLMVNFAQETGKLIDELKRLDKSLEELQIQTKSE